MRGLPVQPPCPEDAANAVTAWNWMGGTIDWNALPVIVEMLGISDVDLLIHQLIALRDHLKESSDA